MTDGTKAQSDSIEAFQPIVNRYRGDYNSSQSTLPICKTPYPSRPQGKGGMSFSVDYRFNTGVNEVEKTIITSTGKYVITCMSNALNLAYFREFPPFETRANRQLSDQGRTYLHSLSND